MGLLLLLSVPDTVGSQFTVIWIQGPLLEWLTTIRLSCHHFGYFGVVLAQTAFACSGSLKRSQPNLSRAKVVQPLYKESKMFLTPATDCYCNTPIQCVVHLPHRPI